MEVVGDIFNRVGELVVDLGVHWTVEVVHWPVPRLLVVVPVESGDRYDMFELEGAVGGFKVPENIVWFDNLA